MLPENNRQQLAALVIRTTRPTPFTGTADDNELERLLLLKRTAPTLLAAELATLATSLNLTAAPPALSILLDNHSDFTAAITNLIRLYVNGKNDNAVLPWEQLIPLLSADRTTAFWTAVPNALENARQTNLLTESDLVRNYAWLAVQAQLTAQPTVARKLFDAAQRHHREPGEATLWLIDARQRLGLPDDNTWENALIERQQLPPVRLGKIITTRPDLQSAAKALELSRWTHHPEVLRRAIPAAKPGTEKQELERALEFYQIPIVK